MKPTRRAVLGGLAAAPLLWRRAPAFGVSEAARPRVDQGVASGDVSPKGAVIWSRADRPARMLVEWSLDPSFAKARVGAVVEVLADTDFTGRAALRGLPAGRDVHYRVVFESLERPGARSAPVLGRLRTPSATPAPLRFAWSGDCCGQGFGINPEIGGMKIFERIRQARPDFFVHCGDAIYADAPLRETRGADGRVWRNLLVPEKTKVAETLAEFRGNFRYNLLDAHLRRLQAEVPVIAQWDDHETKNNWWPGRVLDEDPRYTQVKSCSLLAARARRALFEYNPIAARWDAPQRIYRKLAQGPLLDVFVLDARSYRGPNGINHESREGPETAFFGDAQLEWLCAELAASKATWKLVASDQPLALLIGHHPRGFEGMANGPGEPLGRELELVRLLRFLKREKVRNVVFVTADVHYAAAHHFHPERARFTEFDPFWEFVAGPLNAGTFGPNTLDPTFGPEEVFVSVPRDLKPGRSPFEGLQFYGVGEVDPGSKALTITLHDLEGRALFEKALEPA